MYLLTLEAVKKDHEDFLWRLALCVIFGFELWVTDSSVEVFTDGTVFLC